MRSELGVLVPDSVADQRPIEAPVLRYSRTYLTHKELTGRAVSEGDLVERLRKLSADDCLAQIAHISTRMAAAIEPPFHPSVQHGLVEELFGDGELAQGLKARMERPEPTSIFSEQQMLHLARLVVLHADNRPHDDFDGGALYDEWVTCLFGVTDLLDAGLRVERLEDRLSWELRQCGFNHHEDQLPVLAVHHEVLRELWPKLHAAKAAEIEAAFARHTGMSLRDYFAVGAAIQARFTNYGLRERGLAGVRAAEYFKTVVIGESEWRPFFEFLARDLEGLRAELRQEDADYGATTYGSLTFDRYPLFEAEPGLYLPISMRSLQRRVTEGVFHILAEAAEKDGHDRRHYISPFGDLFQELVEQTFRRGMACSAPDTPMAADVRYGRKGSSRRSSDVILGFEGYPIFVEVVSGPLRVGTVTRGDLNCFEQDLQRLVTGKAEQLDKSIRDFLDGRLQVDGMKPELVRRLFPVIVTSHAFPHAETISAEVERRVREAGYLQGEKIAPLALVSAEELCFCEGFMERGRSFLSLVRGWKSGPNAEYAFKNYLVQLGGGRAPGSEHSELEFARATADYSRRLFGNRMTAEEALRALQS